MRNKYLILSAFAACLSQFAWATPAEIIIIRHGEKPQSGNELNAQGRERAQELVSFFTTDSRVTRFGLPVAIYAMNPASSDESERPIETVTPLADDLHLSVQHLYKKNQVQPLLQEIMTRPEYHGKMVLICWEHEAISELLEVMEIGSPPAPPKWPGHVFNWAYLIDYDGSGNIIQFQNINQDLPMDSGLPGK